MIDRTASSVMPSGDSWVLRRLRAILRGLLGLGLAGTAAELLLIGHYETATQWAPLAVIGLALASLMLPSTSRGGRTAFQVAMLALVAAGLLGTALHHRGSREFQVELDPSLRGLPLILKTMRAKTPPALAPLSLVLCGLLGLASTYKQPLAAMPPVSIPAGEGA
jgi:hypothetical protein